jgi:hypothetical protein
MKIPIDLLAGLLGISSDLLYEYLVLHHYDIQGGETIKNQELLERLFPSLKKKVLRAKDARIVETKKQVQEEIKERVIPYLKDHDLLVTKNDGRGINTLRILLPGTGVIKRLTVRMSRAGKKFGYFMSFRQQKSDTDWYLLIFPFGRYLLRAEETQHPTHDIQFYTPEHLALQGREIDKRIDEFVSSFTK